MPTTNRGLARPGGKRRRLRVEPLPVEPEWITEQHLSSVARTVYIGL